MHSRVAAPPWPQRLLTAGHLPIIQCQPYDRIGRRADVSPASSTRSARSSAANRHRDHCRLADVAFAALSGTGHGCGIADLQRKHPGAHGARVDWVTQTAESSDRRKKEKAAQDLARGATPERHATRATAPHGTTCRTGRQPDHQLPLWTAPGFRLTDLFRFSLSDLHHARCCCALHYLPSLPRFLLPECHPRSMKVQRFPSYSIATANLHAAALQDEPSHTLTPDR